MQVRVQRVAVRTSHDYWVELQVVYGEVLDVESLQFSTPCQVHVHQCTKAVAMKNLDTSAFELLMEALKTGAPMSVEGLEELLEAVMIGGIPDEEDEDD